MIITHEFDDHYMVTVIVITSVMLVVWVVAVFIAAGRRKSMVTKEFVKEKVEKDVLRRYRQALLDKDFLISAYGFRSVRDAISDINPIDMIGRYAEKEQLDWERLKDNISNLAASGYTLDQIEKAVKEIQDAKTTI